MDQTLNVCFQSLEDISGACSLVPLMAAENINMIFSSNVFVLANVVNRLEIKLFRNKSRDEK